MRKKFFSVMLATALTVSLAGSMIGCDSKSSKSKTSDTSTANQEVSAEEYQGTVVSNASVYKKYITVPECKGISVDLDLSEYEVTDDDIQEYIDSIMTEQATTVKKTEGTTASGDVIVLDYAGTLDGVAFSGGTATDVSYTIGSGKFITDLDNGLVGVTVGVETQIPCTFPSDYSSSDLAGKSVIFTVTVKEIDVSVTPDLTDEWIASNYSALGIDEEITTVAKFKEYVKNYLEETALSEKQSDAFDAVYDVITADMAPDTYPEAELQSLLDTLNDNVESEYNSYGSYYSCSSLEDYITNVYGFESMDAFNEYAENYAKEYLLQKMVVTIIAIDNNLEVTADDINSTGEELAEYYGYDSYAEILDQYGDEMNSEIGYQCLYQKVVEFVADNAVINNTAN